MNGTQPSSSFGNPTTETIGKTFVYCLIFLVSLAGEHRHRNNRLQDEDHEKTHQLFNRKHGHLRSAVARFFVIPPEILKLYLMDSWLIGGPLGQALCKLGYFLTDASTAGVYSEPSSNSSGSFWSCGISSPFSTHQFKAVPVLHSRHLDHRDGYLRPIASSPSNLLITKEGCFVACGGMKLLETPRYSKITSHQFW